MTESKVRYVNLEELRRQFRDEGFKPEEAEEMARRASRVVDEELPKIIPDGRGGFYIVDPKNPWDD